MLTVLACFQAVPARPAILTKSDWRGKPALRRTEPHRISHITVHHAGVATNKSLDFATRLRNLQAWCQREDQLANGKKKPAWVDVPYHYYISPEGEIAACRDADQPGDTNTEYDPRGHLLICLEGNFEEAEPTVEQLASLTALTVWAAHEYRVPAKWIRGHSNYAQTSCPGKHVARELDKLRASVRQSRMHVKGS